MSKAVYRLTSPRSCLPSEKRRLLNQIDYPSSWLGVSLEPAWQPGPSPDQTLDDGPAAVAARPQRCAGPQPSITMA